MSVRFVIDAQLPPRLARRLTEHGRRAEHVLDIGLEGASDREIWAYACANRCVVVSKDQDFADLARRDPDGAQVVWIRIGNTTSGALWSALAPIWPEVLAGLERGERLIEIV
jgi:predicted nuclease of predicted toxin-antitoxin system